MTLAVLAGAGIRIPRGFAGQRSRQGSISGRPPAAGLSLLLISGCVVEFLQKLRNPGRQRFGRRQHCSQRFAELSLHHTKVIFAVPKLWSLFHQALSFLLAGSKSLPPTSRLPQIGNACPARRFRRSWASKVRSATQPFEAVRVCGRV
jgi:hypothetical protein